MWGTGNSIRPAVTASQVEGRQAFGGSRMQRLWVYIGLES